MKKDLKLDLIPLDSMAQTSHNQLNDLGINQSLIQWGDLCGDLVLGIILSQCRKLLILLILTVKISEIS